MPEAFRLYRSIELGPENGNRWELNGGTDPKAHQVQRATAAIDLADNIRTARIALNHREGRNYGSLSGVKAITYFKGVLTIIVRERPNTRRALCPQDEYLVSAWEGGIKGDVGLRTLDQDLLTYLDKDWTLPERLVNHCRRMEENLKSWAAHTTFGIAH